MNKKEIKKQNLEPLDYLEPLDESIGLLMGCDPEFFFVNGKGQVVGSEKVLPKKGLKWKDDDFGYSDSGYEDTQKPIFIIDGVQAELNPEPNTCRALLGNDIHSCFLQLRKHLKAEGKTLSINFDPLVKITQIELDSLSESSRVFGCDPSSNVYQTRAQARIRVNPKKYLKRSAGGHIHLGADAYQRPLRRTLKNVKVMVPLLDLVVANTCVLIDRHPGNKERRANYGRCGEYRVKPYGLEYRALSNFWLKSYQLMSLVMGLCRFTVEMAAESESGVKTRDYIKALLNAVPRQDVIKAVQENDWKLAYANFKKIEPIILAAAYDNEYDFPIGNNNIDEFHYFVKKINECGLEYWFSGDSLTHWCNLPDGHDRGWESFCRNRIRKAMRGKYVPINLNAKAPVVAVEA